MRSKILAMLAFATLASGVFMVFAQEPDDEVRGAFLSSRPKTTNTSAPARRHRPRNQNSNTVAKNANTSSAKNANANVTQVTNTNVSGNRNISSAKGPSQAIGLGYTLFMRDINGRTVRVEPTREFHNGDRVR